MANNEEQLQNFLEHELKKYEGKKKVNIDTLVSQSSSIPVFNKDQKNSKHSFPKYELDKTKFKKPIPQSKGFNVKLFEEKMRDHLIKQYKSYQNYERPYISVGELIGCCRCAYFNRKKYTVDISQMFRFPYLYLFQERGNAMHRVVQQMYGLQLVDKSFISKKFKTKGKIDGALNDFLYEIKVMDPGKFTGSYRKDDYDQANLYAFIANSEFGYKFRTITLVYVIGTMRDIIPFDVPINMKRANNIITKSIVLHSCLQENKVPGENLCKRGEDCTWCLYKKYCSKPPKTKSPVNKNKENKKKDPVWLI